MPGALAVATLLFYVATSHGYGYFRDELYYLACNAHLAAGYVDHPPLLEVLLVPVRAVLGDSLPAIRLLPALAAAATVLIAARLVRQLGGGRGAVLTALAGVMTAPLYVGIFSILTPNALEMVFWAVALLLVVRILDGHSPRLWIALGAVVGIGFLDKHGVVFLVIGLAAGIVATPARRHLATRWPWLGLAIAAVLAAPHLVWQALHGWPTLEFTANARAFKNLPQSPLGFVAEQVMVLDPLAAPIWIAGLVSLWRRDEGRYRALVWAYLVILALMIAGRGKAYYIGPYYQLLFAAGGVAFERAAWRRRLAYAVPVAATVVGVAGMPMAKPLLPVERLIAYQHAIGLDPRLGSGERNELGVLPQHFADQFGWQELATRVAVVHRALPPEERARACIYTSNYGEAGAIDFFGPALGLPHAISGHNTYWWWGPRDCDFSTVIVLGLTPDDVRGISRSVEVVAGIDCPYCMPFERRPILVARGPLLSPAEIWRRVRFYL